MSMRLLGIVGWSGSGKTTLIEKLLPLLAESGLRVSTIKRSHHGFDVDTPGKDSWRHRKAGAHEVIVASDLRWALMREQRSDGEVSLEALVARLEPVDLVLVEGFSARPHHKIEVWRAAENKPLRATGDPGLVAVAAPPTDWRESEGHESEGRAWLDLDDAPSVARFILAWTQRAT